MFANLVELARLPASVGDDKLLTFLILFLIQKRKGSGLFKNCCGGPALLRDQLNL